MEDEAFVVHTAGCQVASAFAVAGHDGQEALVVAAVAVLAMEASVVNEEVPKDTVVCHSYPDRRDIDTP